MSEAQTTAPRRHRWWHWLVPSTLLVPSVQVLLASRLLSELGMATLTYGAMVHIAREGARPLEVTLLSTAGAVAALVFGIRGGLIADTLSRRVALALAYLLQAALCIAVPIWLGTSFTSLLLLVFAVRLLTQVVSPAVKSAVVLVARATEVGTGITLLSMAGGIGSGLGTAVLAPTLVKLFDIRVLLWVVGAILLVAAIRTLRLPGEQGGGDRERERDPDLSLFRAGRWLAGNPALAGVISAGAVVAVLNDVFEALQPVFVRDVIGTDPTNSVYVFAPGLVGTILAVVLGPLLVRWPGERWLIGVAIGAISLGMVLFGLINRVDQWLAPLSPLHLVGQLGMNLSTPILAAGAIACLIRFGAGAAALAAQAYINRNVAYHRQGGAFGMQTVIQNAIGVGGTLVAGAVADRFGTVIVFLLAPVVIFAAVTLVIPRDRDEKPDAAGAEGRALAPGGAPGV